MSRISDFSSTNPCISQLLLSRAPSAITLPAERDLHGAGNPDPRVFRDTYRRTGPSRRVGVREGIEEYFHILAPGGPEQAQTIPCGEEEETGAEVTEPEQWQLGV